MQRKNYETWNLFFICYDEGWSSHNDIQIFEIGEQGHRDCFLSLVPYLGQDVEWIRKIIRG